VSRWLDVSQLTFLRVSAIDAHKLAVASVLPIVKASRHINPRIIAALANRATGPRGFLPQLRHSDIASNWNGWHHGRGGGETTI
jgi:hypothetical protein